MRVLERIRKWNSPCVIENNLWMNELDRTFVGIDSDIEKFR